MESLDKNICHLDVSKSSNAFYGEKRYDKKTEKGDSRFNLISHPGQYVITARELVSKFRLDKSLVH